MSAQPGRKEYNALSAIVLAPLFYQPLYRDVARNWRGIGALYLLLLIAITGAITASSVHRAVKKFAREEFPKVVQDVPPISIRDGVVSSPVKQPYQMIDHESGKVMAIIDTTGTVTSLDNTPAIMLLTKSQFHHRQNNKIEIQDLSQFKSADFDRAKLQHWMDVAAGWSGPVTFLAILIFVFIYRLIQALIYALIGMAFAAMFGARLSYQQLIRLAIIAVTPAMLLSTALGVAGIDIPFFWPICFVIAMVYLAIAVRANADQSSQRPGGFEVYTPPSPTGGRPMGI